MSTSLFILLTTLRMVVIPTQFPDCEFTSDSTDIAQTIEKTQAYFDTELRDQISLELIVANPVTLSKPRSYYGVNYPDRKDILLYEAVKEAARLAAEEIDFSQIDADADGRIDNIVLLMAGTSEDECGDAQLISQQHALLSDYGGSIAIDGKTLDSYSVCCELRVLEDGSLGVVGIGVICHEIAHALGLPDLYDSDGEGSGGYSTPMRGSSLMDEGCKREDWHNPPPLTALECEILEIGTREELAIGEYTLAPFASEPRYLRAQADKPGDYYLFACADARLQVYHIDNSSNPAGHSDYYGRSLSAAERWQYNQINCRPDHACAALVAMLPDDQQHAFGSDTAIPFHYWSGQLSSIALTDIRSNSDNSVSFNVIEPIVITNIIPYQDAVTLEWKLDESLHPDGGYELMCIGARDTTIYQAEKWQDCYTIEGLEPYTQHKVSIRAIVSSSESYSVSSYFVTKSYRKDTFPNIYLTGVQRNKDGSFLRDTEIPLRVLNAGTYVRIDWYFNEEAITPSPRGTYRLIIPGRLKAEIFYEDGSKDIIIKEIQL